MLRQGTTPGLLRPPAFLCVLLPMSCTRHGFVTKTEKKPMLMNRETDCQ